MVSNHTTPDDGDVQYIDATEFNGGDPELWRYHLVRKYGFVVGNEMVLKEESRINGGDSSDIR